MLKKRVWLLAICGLGLLGAGFWLYDSSDHAGPRFLEELHDQPFSAAVAALGEPIYHQELSYEDLNTIPRNHLLKYAESHPGVRLFEARWQTGLWRTEVWSATAAGETQERIITSIHFNTKNTQF